MKKKVTKLRLAKETLRTLEEPVLGWVAAGGSGNYNCLSYVCPTSAGPEDLCAFACIGL